tara:strand:- start:668 stop:850 length:183 start_codon:yes stop_codon:yes gene_type:complete
MNLDKGVVKYKVTGVLRNARRFRAIHTDSYMHAVGINLWRGSVWSMDDGKWRRIRTVFND